VTRSTRIGRSIERRLAVAGVGLVPSPVGLGRHGVAIETTRDEEFLCCADEVAFTEEVRLLRLGDRPSATPELDGELIGRQVPHHLLLRGEPRRRRSGERVPVELAAL
jgi:hypothetical protein